MHKNKRDLKKRVKLAEVLPLATPFSIYIDPSSACNFHCNFCYQGISSHELKKLNFSPKIMTFELFKKIVTQISKFPDKIKCIGLTGIGEPFLNKDLPQMVRYLKHKNVTEKITITTNGSILKPNISHAIAESGLDELTISVEAMSSEKYLAITKTHVVFKKLVDNIKYLFNLKPNFKIYIKIVNIAFDEDCTENKFHEIFDDICDLAYVENVVPQFKHVDYDTIDTTYEQSLYGGNVPSLDICSKIFYVMQIGPSGNIIPCCVDFNETVVFGNVNEQSLYEIWNGIPFNNFRKKHLNKKRKDIPLCSNCRYFKYNIRVEDILDNEAKTLVEKY